MEYSTILFKVLHAFIMMGVVLFLAFYSVLAERKISGWIQWRVGPNRTTLPFIQAIPVIGPWLTRLGVFQPIADGLKFLFKEEVVPGHVNKFYYSLAPILTLAPALIVMAVIPFGQFTNAEGVVQPLILAELDIGILFIFAISSLGVYGIVLAGWSSNSKYPFLGGIRASAQMISYELAMALAVLPVFIWASHPGAESGLSLVNIVKSQNGLWLCLWQPLSALIFLVALFAETNRLPFDMAESETDLVGGFHTEYGCFKFGLLFAAEYTHVVLGSAVYTLLFLGGWNFLPGIPNPWPIGWSGAVLSTLWFLAKTACVIFFFMWIRWTLPRFRYDQVMKLGWTILLPVALANLILNTFIIALWDIGVRN